MKAPRHIRPAERAVWWLALSLGLLGLVLLSSEVALGVSVLLDLVLHLVTGWLRFLVENLPVASFNPALAANFGIAVIVIVICLHCVLRHAMPQRIPGQRIWRWKWTISWVAMPGLFFGIHLAMHGAVTTSEWLLSQPTHSWVHQRALNKVRSRMLVNVGKELASEGSGRIPDSMAALLRVRRVDLEMSRIIPLYDEDLAHDVPEYWTWLGGTALTTPGDVPVAVAPRSRQDGTRIIAFLDGTSKKCSYEEWQAALVRWRLAVAAEQNKPEEREPR